MKLNISLIIMFLFLTGCSDHSHVFTNPTNNAVENWPCANSTSLMFDVAYVSLVEHNHIPTVEELVKAFEVAIEKKNPSFNRVDYLNQVASFYSAILDGADTLSTKSMLKHIAAIEIGDQSDPSAELRQNNLKAFKNRYHTFVTKNNGVCSTTPNNPAPPPAGPAIGLNIPNAVAWGANKTMSVGYQSCSAIEKNPMEKTTPNLQGISIVGKNGAGYYRKVTDLKSFIDSHYYIEKTPQVSTPESCINVRQLPLIYDYGGKPYATGTSRSLDLFKNDGSGGSTLGIDCSGFVYTAITSAGLRLEPNVEIKPILVNGVSAAMFKNPSQNGLGCFSKISVGKDGDLQPGDIIAESGHVVIVDSVGSDPLGISKVKIPADCDTLTSSNFDFVIIQSSPSKNGIGINKFIAKDYLVEDSAMKIGLTAYARLACKARLQGTQIAVSNQSAQVVRHSRSPECSESAVNLNGENCIKQCAMLQ